MKKVLLCLLTITPVSYAVDWQFQFQLSQATMVGSCVSDAVISLNHKELNPLLRDASGNFGTKGLLIKSGLSIGIVLLERYIVKREGKKALKPIAITNYVVTGYTAAVIARNLNIKYVNP